MCSFEETAMEELVKEIKVYTGLRHCVFSFLSLLRYCHTGFGLIIIFSEPLQLITTSHYNSLTGLHTIRITVTAAHI
jgi:hypothetical protein